MSWRPMAEWICRTLRDGGVEGEHALALSITDTINCPLGSSIFDHVLSQLTSGIVLVALSRSPLYYEQLLKSKGYDLTSSKTRFKILDCYTDPLGWRSKLLERGVILYLSPGSSTPYNLCKYVNDSEKLLPSVLELGAELSGDRKGRFVVAFDSVSELLRHMPVSSVAALLCTLRANDQVCSLFWSYHSDLHETRVAAALEYISSMKATVDPPFQLVGRLNGDSEHLSLMEHNLKRGRLCVCVKRRNGRVRMMFEELSFEKSIIKFTPVSSETEVAAQNLLPKVQFNMQLSEKERSDRAKVVLPFEHQGNGKTIQIYDGRNSLNKDGDEDVKMQQNLSVDILDASRGEIIYFRDSDDEMPDSDEDPDDDLDI